MIPGSHTGRTTEPPFYRAARLAGEILDQADQTGRPVEDLTIEHLVGESDLVTRLTRHHLEQWNEHVGATR
jgi:hypothetical protein